MRNCEKRVRQSLRAQFEFETDYNHLQHTAERNGEQGMCDLFPNLDQITVDLPCHTH